MAVAARKYNPGFLTDDELVASFCVRTTEFESLVEILRECTGNSNPHQIVIGPRGSGKTSLLLRIAAEVRRDAELATSFFPIVFAEESYEVATVGDFWLECLSHLTDQAPRQENDPDLRRTYEELRTIGDNQVMADRCLGALLDFSDQEGKRLVLMVENLNMMLSDMTDSEAGWRLRKILQTEPRIILFASATSRFDEIDNPRQAMYDLFGVRALLPLETSECAALWETVAGRCPPPETIRSLQILTGGSPRWLVILAHFGAELSFRKLMDDLLDLVDDHTEYFKSHLESLPAQERRVYLALATLWKPATTREISDHTRIETSKCSAQLKRLIERGAVQAVGGSARRKHYYLTERLYNIYYLLRRHGRSGRLVEALIRFMESYYSPAELKDISAGIAQEAGSFGEETQSLARITLTRLMELPALAGHRNELLEMMPDSFAETFPQHSAPADEARELFKKAIALHDQNRADDTLTAFDEVVRRFGKSKAPAVLKWVAKALVHKGILLQLLNQTKDAVATYDEVVRRFAESETQALFEVVTKALVNKAAALTEMDQPQDGLAACEDILRRLENSDTAAVLPWVATAMFNKGFALHRLNQMKDALDVYDEVVRRFAHSENPILLEATARALVNKGIALGKLNRPKDMLTTWDEVAHRFGQSENPELLEATARALLNKGFVLEQLNQTKDALGAYDEVVRRFGQREYPALRKQVEDARLGKVHIELNLRLYKSVTETASCVLDECSADSPEKRSRWYLIRAKAALAGGDQSACEHDIQAVLTLLPELSALPKESVDALILFSVELGADRIGELIHASPSAPLLLPLTTALERELGLNPRVAREVEEVAEDIQRNLAKLKDTVKRGAPTQ